jgi:hypothetical protein
MKIQLLTVLVAAAMLSAPAFARHGADDPAGHIRGEGAGHALIVLPDSLLQVARRGRGADDPAGHVRGEGAGHASITGPVELMQMARRGRGADDAPGHQRQCRGCDDGANHT